MNMNTGGKSIHASGTSLLAGQEEEKSEYLDSIFPQVNFWQIQIDEYTKTKKQAKKPVPQPDEVENFYLDDTPYWAKKTLA